MPNGFGNINGRGGVDIMYTRDRKGQSVTLISDLSLIMRPFESKLFQTTRGRPQKEQPPEEEAVFTLTASARVEVTTISAMGWSYQWPNDDDSESDVEEDEVTRETTVKRITNPNDPAQYVDVEVVDYLLLKDNNRRLVSMKLNNQ